MLVLSQSRVRKIRLSLLRRKDPYFKRLPRAELVSLQRSIDNKAFAARFVVVASLPLITVVWMGLFRWTWIGRSVSNFLWHSLLIDVPLHPLGDVFSLAIPIAFIWLFVVGFYQKHYAFVAASHLPAPWHSDCPTCGYDLSGNASDVCPECGRKVSACESS